MKSNVSPNYLLFTNGILDMDLSKKETSILNDRKVQGGIFDEINLVYGFGLIINFILYVLVIS